MEYLEQNSQEKEVKNLEYNQAQFFFLLAFQKFKVLEWGRGTGKSTILGKDIIDKVTQLPRSTGVMVAETYAQIKTRTLPSTIAGLEQHGIHKDIHFFIGKRPPASWNWPEPIEPILDYTHCMIFWNGAIMVFLSQDGGGASGRGLNIDWVVADEAARLDKDLFETDVILALRGGNNKKAIYPDGTWKHYEDCPLHHSVTLATSTPVTLKGRWILKYEELAVLHPEKYCFLSASAEVNRHNLKDDFFETAKAILPDFLYRAEIENERIQQVTDGFYPLLDEQKHTYTAFNNEYYKSLVDNTEATCLGDADLNLHAPLIGGLDWGANINCLVICQDNNSAFNILKNIYVKYPLIIDDLVAKFVKYYEHHQNKVLNLWYDPSGNNAQANSKRTYAQQVQELLNAAGWTVNLMTRWNNQESHTLKYRLWQNLLKGTDPKYPIIKINKHNCQELWISMTNAPAKQGYNEAIKKDKSSEKKKGFDQAHATHFSDAADVIVVGMFLHFLNQQQSVPDVSIR